MYLKFLKFLKDSWLILFKIKGNKIKKSKTDVMNSLMGFSIGSIENKYCFYRDFR